MQEIEILDNINEVSRKTGLNAGLQFEFICEICRTCEPGTGVEIEATRAVTARFCPECGKGLER